jgi:hypothetical protein
MSKRIQCKSISHIKRDPKEYKHHIVDYFYVPAPGKVQYYKAIQYPFLPPEVRVQIRRAKTYAMSRPNLRYLDQVKEETQKFLNQEIKFNYFSGEDKISLDTTLGVAEAIFNASDEVKALGESGRINQLHTNCANFLEESEKSYIN